MRVGGDQSRPASLTSPLPRALSLLARPSQLDKSASCLMGESGDFVQCVHRTWRPISRLPFLQILREVPGTVLALRGTSPALTWGQGRQASFPPPSFQKH